MAKLLLLLVLSLWTVDSQKFDDVIPINMNNSANDSNKDMYVIHAMVYQIGILTNSSDYKELENETHTGAEEALTFYHTNGTNIDLSSIPQPLLTNITGQNFVGVAPASTDGGQTGNLTWSARAPGAIDHARGASNVRRRDTEASDDSEENSTATEDDSSEYIQPPQEPGGDDMYFPGFFLKRAKRDTEEETDTEKFLKVVNGNAVIPQGAGIQSVALPPLLSLNNNLSDIPVPIPNTSIVHYARVNTLITSTNDTS